MKTKVALSLLSLLIISMVGCSNEEVLDITIEEPINIVTTIFPLADLIGQLGGDQVEVSYLLPTGSSPHTFEPTTDQARSVANARLFIYVGAGLDDWAVKLIETGSDNLTVLELASYIQLMGIDDCDDHDHEDEIDPAYYCEHDSVNPEANNDHEDDCDHHHESATDPHFWLDPVLVSSQLLPKVYDQLCLIAPEKQPLFYENLIAVQAELTVLNQEIEAQLAATGRKDFIAFHSAWQYFAVRYGLNELAVVASFPGQEPSAGWIAELIEIISENDVGAILVEPQFSQNLASAISAEAKIKMLTVDPLGGENLPGRGTYQDLMRYNLKVFQEALE